MTGIVFNIQKYCISDGDGIRTSVFLKGCPLSCKWCHNPEGLSCRPQVFFYEEKCSLCGMCLECSNRTIENGKMIIDRGGCNGCGLCVSRCPNKANEITGKEMSSDEIISEVIKDKIFYESSGGGMTLSGGEPSMQSDFSLELTEKALDNGIKTSLESCGIGDFAFYRAMHRMGVTFLYDIKCLDSEKHKALCGVSNERILSNLNGLFDLGADIIIRIPLVPSFNDGDDDISAIRNFLEENKGLYRRAEVMPYHNMGLGKAKRLDYSAKCVQENPDNECIERWRRLLPDYAVFN